ncbi:Uncharacterized protein FWK35_00023851 [Aphis craccivora]|uniref:Uncharacterized protein n=1 Tax=Aphis craccivora TaxID=307492 RepID=A0A6G0Z137_APHCR|nr:Uncharacterized protein FWK35_00023851 [Aphis craccivora]
MYKIKILTEKLEAIELNIIDALMLIDNLIASLTEMNKDDISMNNLRPNNMRSNVYMGGCRSKKSFRESIHTPDRGGGEENIYWSREDERERDGVTSLDSQGYPPAAGFFHKAFVKLCPRQRKETTRKKIKEVQRNNEESVPLPKQNFILRCLANIALTQYPRRHRQESPPPSEINCYFNGIRAPFAVYLPVVVGIKSFLRMSFCTTGSTGVASDILPASSFSIAYSVNIGDDVFLVQWEDTPRPAGFEFFKGNQFESDFQTPSLGNRRAAVVK